MPSTCPVDGIVYTNESVRLLQKARRQRSVCRTDSKVKNWRQSAIAGHSSLHLPFLSWN